MSAEKLVVISVGSIYFLPVIKCQVKVLLEKFKVTPEN